MTSAGGTACAECGRALPADARFCQFCGTPVRAASDEVRKVVTLLFCDVTGSTALGEELDPEVLRGMMARYFAVAKTSVERHGGMVEKFVGDAVLAVFGIPEAREDDALRAVRAAAELRGGLAALSDELLATTGARLQVRTGVNTGSVIAGAARAGGSFATGDAVNTAARLEQAAPPGEILLGEMTYSLVRDAVVAEPVEPLPLKGKAQPVPAYLLLDVLDAERGRLRPSVEALVGRDASLRTLHDAFRRADEGGHLELVTVLGSAGMGKSALLDGFRTELGERAQVLSGRCLSYGHGITFWPIAQMVRQVAGVGVDAGADDVRTALLGVLAGFADAPLAAQRLMTLLGFAGEPGSSTEVFWAVRSLFGHLAGSGPLVITVDDLHWAEPLLLDLLDDVRDELRDVPVLLVAQARPELLENRPGWGAGSAYATTFSLDPLSRDQTAELLAGALGAPLPAEVVDAIAGWAGGNPLYVVEAGAHLVETGALVRDGDGWAIPGDMATIPVPPSVTALLTARLDHLPEPERALLGRLSVIGLEFDGDDATAVAAPGSDVAALLSALHRRDVLRRVRGPGSVTWTFRHVLVRDAAYESLPKALRAEIHERFADRLADAARSTGAEHAAFQAHHLEQALRLQREISAAPSVVEALTERAVAALTAAAHAADDSDDVDAAAALTERVCALLPQADRRSRRLLFRLTSLTLDRAQVGRARILVQRLTDLQEVADDADELETLAVEVFRGRIALEAAEDIDPAVLDAAAERLVALAHATGDLDALGAGIRAACMCCAMRGHWRRVFDLATELTNTSGLRGAHLSESYREAGAMWGPTPVREALAICTGVLRDPAAPSTRVVAAKLVRAPLLAYDGQLDAAREVVVSVEPALAEIDTFLVTVAAFYLSRFHRACGNLEAASSSLAAGAAAAAGIDSLSYASTLLGDQALILLELGRAEDALPILERAESITSAFDALSLACCRGARAILAARAGRLDEAADLAGEALRYADSTDQVVEQANLRRQLTVVARARGDLAAERELLTSARERYVAKGVRPYLAATDEQLRELADGAAGS